MKAFMDENFLLQSPTAQALYHNHAAHLPIIDYHCHLNPKEVAEDHRFSGITELWLGGDHYKWRALRSNGVDEKFITGDASDWEKFQKWAETMPYCMRNPLYHWTHLELRTAFGINKLLNAATAREIYDECNEKMQSPEFSARGLMRRYKVEVVCTTDDPADTLEHHIAIKKSGFEDQEPYVISSLNRFAVLAAHQLGIHSCFIDTLTYLWDKIPDDYLKADMYYTSDFPTVSDKVIEHKNAIITPLIIDNALGVSKKDNVDRNGIILQLGGLKSPLSDNPPTDYVDLISVALNKTQKNITVCGGADGLRYLKQQVCMQHIEFVSLSKDDFLRKLSASELCISTPGLNTTIESIYFKTPINFIMPSNLSQWVNHNIFTQLSVNGMDVTWETIVEQDLNIQGLPEYDAIIKINKMANDVKKSRYLINRFTEAFQKTLSCVPDINKQYTLLKTYGTNGSEFIFEDICKRWKINNVRT